MPELPEVETSRRGIDPHVCNRQIHQVIIREARLRWPVDPQIARILPGSQITSTDRRGKYLLIYTSEGCLIVHLGMSGSVRIVEASEPVKKHDHIDIVLDNQTALRYHDPRRFGAMLWTTAPVLEHERLRHLGPEPLDESFDTSYLYRYSRSKKVPVKTFIMDSRVVVGVGNIYANEALYMAGISPKKESGTISRQRYERLVAAIKEVIANAINVGGTTLRDFVGSDGKPGYFKQSLQVYGRAGQPCLQCHTPLTEIRIAQRSTVYCRKCQR